MSTSRATSPPLASGSHNVVAELRTTARDFRSAARPALEYLFLPRCLTADIGELIKAAFCRAIQIVRWSPGDPWHPPSKCSLHNATVYGGLGNGRLVARHLGGRMLEPSLDLLPTLPQSYRKRRVERTTLASASAITRRAFFKPAVASEFPAGVYESGERIPAKDLDPGLAVLVAEPVTFDLELRTFVLDRKVYADSAYAHFETATIDAAERRQALTFARRVLRDPRVELPRALVLDVGYIRDRGWAVVEANPAVASGIYGCEPDAVLEVIRYGIESA